MLFKMVNEIILVSNSVSHQPVIHVTRDASDITQPNIQYTVTKLLSQYNANYLGLM
jgi:hypothetical protein